MIKGRLGKSILCILLAGMMVTAEAAPVMAAGNEGDSAYAVEMTAGNAEADEAENEDPGKWRYEGKTDASFYGNRARAAVYAAEEEQSEPAYVHDPRFEGYTIKKGIDISYYNSDNGAKPIDWEKVKADGVEFVFVRVGYRGHGTGRMVEDPVAKEQIKGAVKAGIPVGVYFFSQAITEEEGIEEAEFALKQIEGLDVRLPIVMDVEFAGGNGTEGRLYEAHLGKSKQTAICEAFSKVVKEAGYEPMIYANWSFLWNNLYADEVSTFAKVWLARYGTEAKYTGDYEYWQYTSQGAVDGITGNRGLVDMNFWYVPKESGKPAEPEKPVEPGTPEWKASGMETSVASPQLMNTKIQLNAKVSGKTDGLQYKFVWMKDNWAKWGVIKDFSNSPSCTWEAKDSGNYELYLDVKDSSGKTVSVIKKYNIKNWGMSGVKTNLPTPQKTGTAITISPKVEGTNNLLKYKYVWMKDNWKKWGVIQDASTKKEAVWKPGEEGEYQLYVDVVDETGTSVTSTMKYVITKADWVFEGIKFDKASPQQLGTPVNITAQIKNADSSLKYKFVWAKDNWKEWGVIRDFSNESTVKWIPEKEGSYQIYIDVKDGQNGRLEHKNVPYEVVNKKWKYEGITINQNSPQEIGTIVKISPNVSGNAKNLQYKYVWMKDNWKDWGVIKDFSSADSMSWTPEMPGEYTLYVDVKDGTISESKNIHFKVIPGTWEIGGINFDLESPQTNNTEISIAAKIIGNKTGLQYKYVWMTDNWKKWGVIPNKSSQSKASWKPTEAGMYKIYLDVSDSSGKTVTFVTDYEIVTTKVVINPSNTGIAGKAVTISIEGISHNKDLRYKYVWMKDNWSEWNVIRDFSESQMIKWTPEKKGEYSLYVDIMNIKTNKVVTHTVRYTVN